jgi:putative phosphoribosyl transferase
MRGRIDARSEAGRALAARIARLGGAAAPPVVVALAGGGVPLGAGVAAGLGAPLDAMVAAGVRPPGAEVEVGAVAFGGVRVIDAALARRLGLDARSVEAAFADAAAEVERRAARIRGDLALPRLRGRTVVLAAGSDATPLALRAALRAVAARGPARTIVGIPAGAERLEEAARDEGAEVVTAAGAAADEPPPDDAEVVAILASHAARERGEPEIHLDGWAEGIG